MAAFSHVVVWLTGYQYKIDLVEVPVLCFQLSKAVGGGMCIACVLQ